MRQEAVGAHFTVLFRGLSTGAKKTRKYLNKYSQSPGGDKNSGPTKQEAGV